MGSSVLNLVWFILYDAWYDRLLYIRVKYRILLVGGRRSFQECITAEVTGFTTSRHFWMIFWMIYSWLKTDMHMMYILSVFSGEPLCVI